MFRVTTVNLSPDALSADVFYETREMGDLGDAEFEALLQAFAGVDPVQNQEHDPQIHATGAGTKLVIRTSQGRLFAYDPRDQASPATEATAGQIMARLDTAEPGPSADRGESAAEARGDTAAPHRGIAVAMLIVGLALNGYTLYSALYIEHVRKAPPVTLLTDQAEAAARQKAAAGTYATGDRQGDRVIIVGADGSLRIYEIGARGPINVMTDKFRVGHHDGLLCLSTLESGVVDILGSDSVSYFRDTYQRTGAK